MATTTANYGLWKPESEDFVRAAVGPLAQNFDIIDETLGTLYLLRALGFRAAHDYILEEPLFSGGSLYRCTTSHHSGSVVDLSKFTIVSSGGGGGAVSSVDALTGAVDLTTRYGSFLNGYREPWEALSKAGVTYVPDLSVGGRKVITNTANGLTVNMPTVAVDTHVYGWRLRLLQDATGGRAEPSWDAKVTWRGPKSARASAANAFDDYWFETEDNTTWWGYHLSALFSHGQAYDDWIAMGSTPSAPVVSNTLRQYVDTDKVLKVRGTDGEVHHCQIHVGTTAPTNTAMAWLNIS